MHPDQWHPDVAVIPGQNSGKPTAETVADALIRYETGGMCHFGQTCGTCDCGRSSLTVEGLAEQDAMELGRARAVLALIPPQRCAPSEDELANVLRDILVRVFEQDKDIVAQDAARAVLALFSERRCAPSGDEIRNILHDAMCGDRCEPHAMRLHARMGRAVLALYGDQPTVAQAQAEALRQAARDWSDWDGLSAPEEWLARRADAIESGADWW